MAGAPDGLNAVPVVAFSTREQLGAQARADAIAVDTGRGAASMVPDFLRRRTGSAAAHGRV